MFAMLALPFWYQLLIVGVLGAVMASFINVVAYRMHTGASLNGRSRCFSCAHTLRWYELVPIVSYLTLRGRCGSCGARIAARDLVVEIVLAAVFVVLYLMSDSLALFLAEATLATLLTGVVLYDLAHFIIPNEFVLAIAGVVVLIRAIEWYGVWSLSALFVASVTALMAFASYGSLWLVSRGRWMGLGDAKLALPLGFLLTPTAAFSMVVLSFWIGAAVAVLLLCAQSLSAAMHRYRYAPAVVESNAKYLTMKSEIPFAPFLVAAFAVIYLGGVDILDLLLHVLI